MMNEKRAPRLFTPADANRMLPLVAAIAEDWQGLWLSVEERRRRLEHLVDGRELDHEDPYSGELAQVRRELTLGHRQVGEFAKELRQLGVLPGDPELGTVDFPTRLDGEDACMCWTLGEPEVLHWHPVGAKCASRQRLTADTLSGGGPI